MTMFQVLIAILLALSQALAQVVNPFVIDGPLGG